MRSGIAIPCLDPMPFAGRTWGINFINTPPDRARKYNLDVLVPECGVSLINALARGAFICVILVVFDTL